MFAQKNNLVCKTLFETLKSLAGCPQFTRFNADIKGRGYKPVGAKVLDAMESAFENALSTDFLAAEKNAEDYFWCCAWFSIECTSEYQDDIRVRNWFAAYGPQIIKDCCSEYKISDGVTGD
jgi:hypothetical protein